MQRWCQHLCECSAFGLDLSYIFGSPIQKTGKQRISQNSLKAQGCFLALPEGFFVPMTFSSLILEQSIRFHCVGGGKIQEAEEKKTGLAWSEIMHIPLMHRVTYAQKYHMRLHKIYAWEGGLLQSSCRNLFLITFSCHNLLHIIQRKGLN